MLELNRRSPETIQCQFIPSPRTHLPVHVGHGSSVQTRSYFITPQEQIADKFNDVVQNQLYVGTPETSSELRKRKRAEQDIAEAETVGAFGFLPKLKKRHRSPDFTADEDATLRKGIIKYGRDFKMIKRVLFLESTRSARQLRNRYKNLDKVVKRDK